MDVDLLKNFFWSFFQFDFFSSMMRALKYALKNVLSALNEEKENQISIISYVSCCCYNIESAVTLIKETANKFQST